ncbi:nuclear transport factor 2 family protein [Luteimonas sp. S4-F44]|uniref:nuclear transport factor 2 family protein n=1 Tax=Luteimonas sp. S4-F44 TaxID=2925842 RepID=UPI001F5308F5|nr:nuclear transport factor 2 family protein [Luteimonas sp. S4-F44]UNK41053.1 nuclear transport factor 2 family protein [Luteimonas sp. S4-F44]
MAADLNIERGSEMTVFHRRSILIGLTTLVAGPLAWRTVAEAKPFPSNVDIVKELYLVAESGSLDADRFVSLFADDGYFLDVPSGQRWVGQEIREPVTGLIRAYPDMHRELLEVYSAPNNVVVVELRLQGSHRGDLPLRDGVLRATNKEFDVPCCDVWHLENGKVKSFHCYNNLVATLMG